MNTEVTRPFPEGSLLRSRGASPIYLVVRGRRRHIPDGATFRYLQFQPDRVIQLSQTEVDALPLGDRLPTFEGREVTQIEESHSSVAVAGHLPELTHIAPGRLRVLLSGVVLLALFAAAVYVPELVHYPNGLTADGQAKARADLRTSLIQVMAALSVLAGLYFSVQTILLSRQTLAATTYNQVAERYTTALQLIVPGNAVSTRLGGLLSLSRIARASVTDRPSIATYFTTLLKLDSVEGGRHDVETSAILKGLSELRQIGFKAPYNLTDCKLRNLGGGGIAASRSDFSRSCIDDFVAYYSDLTDSKFIDAKLNSVDLRFSRLQRILVRSTVTQNVDVSWCDLEDAVCILSDFRGISLVGSRLDRAHFIGVDLREANLRHTDLSGVNLSDCNLEGAFYDVKTVWPQGFDVVASGARPD